MITKLAASLASGISNESSAVVTIQEGLEVEVRGYDLETLGALAARVAEVVRDVPGITDVDVSREAGTPQAEIRIDREAIARLGYDLVRRPTGGRRRGRCTESPSRAGALPRCRRAPSRRGA